MCKTKSVYTSSTYNAAYIGSYVSIWFLNDAAGTEMSSYVSFNKFDNINSSPTPTIPIKTPSPPTQTTKTTTTTATTTIASQTNACQKAFCDAMLQRHNQLRSKHSAPALSQDATLNQNAQAYASKLAQSNNGLVHSGGAGYGENLALIMDSRLNGPDVATCTSMKL